MSGITSAHVSNEDFYSMFFTQSSNNFVRNIWFAKIINTDQANPLSVDSAILITLAKMSDHAIANGRSIETKVNENYQPCKMGLFFMINDKLLESIKSVDARFFFCRNNWFFFFFSSATDSSFFSSLPVNFLTTFVAKLTRPSEDSESALSCWVLNCELLAKV